MSIWRTQFDIDIPARDDDCQPVPNGHNVAIGIATTWNPLIRLTVEFRVRADRVQVIKKHGGLITFNSDATP